jgi:tRNA pseudouridine32 synthase/23S rRNA pseudouridine746 synthase
VKKDSSFSILFQNDAVVAVDKPGGYLSVPSRMGAQDPRPCLGRELEKSLGLRLWPIHRLDEEVTGVILFALTPGAHKDLSMAFENRAIGKRYEALTDLGSQPWEEEEVRQEVLWECLMLRGKKRAYQSPHGKPASTRAKLLANVTLSDGPALRWTLSPLTGRGHQLRFELFRHGFPIIGDTLYGSKRDFGRDLIALRCVTLSFIELSSLTAKLGLPEEIAAPPWLIEEQSTFAHQTLQP